MAIAFVRRVSEAGINVPRDVSVVGFDGASVGAFTVPSLSTVSQPTAQMGQEVVGAIIALMNRRTDVSPRTVVPSVLILRESIGDASAR
jgi:LacI family repressor for deo operon, udp, cdd, tsx, nupC, and nupG